MKILSVVLSCCLLAVGWEVVREHKANTILVRNALVLSQENANLVALLRRESQASAEWSIFAIDCKNPSWRVRHQYQNGWPVTYYSDLKSGVPIVSGVVAWHGIK